MPPSPPSDRNSPVTSGLAGDLRAFTPARVALGRAGVSLPTAALLQFTRDHARARDAVHAVFESAALTRQLGELQLPVCEVRSRVASRPDYLRRPDLGRRLDPASAEHLAKLAAPPCPLAVVIGDGLSPRAARAHGPAVLRALLPFLAMPPRTGIGAVVVASEARVALGDEIGAILGASLVLVLIGERPGLSAPDSLGAYLTFAPGPGRSDAERNCVSNIHPAGLGYEEAAFKIAWLIRRALTSQMTGVALKDASGEAWTRRLTTGTASS